MIEQDNPLHGLLLRMMMGEFGGRIQRETIAAFFEGLVLV
ncbi:hypothetical protein QO016_004738 [Methylobacterium persicinum]|uniref:Uncharacterized protein n=1 Tax=Methylobacterium persicinum TaxID=374426 RepID=A0ABU0HUN2_9HYPH|nr:hypothetical protein [Methylobacterium persicinum]